MGRHHTIEDESQSIELLPLLTRMATSHETHSGVMPLHIHRADELFCTLGYSRTDLHKHRPGTDSLPASPLVYNYRVKRSTQ